MKTKINQFIEHLAAYEGSPTVFNPWRDFDPQLDVSKEAPKWRREQLAKYLETRLGQSSYVIIAEAMGYQGGRFSGVAITCERMLLGFHSEVKPDMILPDGSAKRTSRADSPLGLNNKQRIEGFNEPTDTVVWSALLENDISTYEAVLWNIFPFHPHVANEPLTNRTPSEAELVAGGQFAKELLALNEEFKTVKSGCEQIICAVGRKSADILARQGITAHALRHPANGGAKQYREQFKAVVTG